ncbi:glycerate kinase [Egibacter rhizosphaerae]|uniref:glycerate kinase n=1 Tax=Egibacter rhizosphaerae TaxID=1670831 RepID=UPI0013F154FF|nr:glycerate kinase [Egibacter rhizosphaerae]
MRVVVAPDKFAGTLSAREAAEAVARGWRRARPDDELALIPTADGGEGTLDVVADAVSGVRVHEAEVVDATGHARTARWVALPSGPALVEGAEACGLAHVSPEHRDPRWATSYGVGQLIRTATDSGVTRIVVTLGGTATVDGGAGAVLALGHRLRRPDGNGVKVGALPLLDLATIEPAPALEVPVTAAVDVANPLLGPDGAVAVFAPQKGASPEDLPRLEEALTRFADVVEGTLPGGPWREVPGAGAAGGLGFALAAFCDARLEGGAAAVAALTGLDRALDHADVVVTGEGRLDAQTRHSKAPGWVRDRAHAAGARALAIAGQILEDAGAAFDDAADLGPHGFERAAELVAERAAELAGRLP